MKHLIIYLLFTLILTPFQSNGIGVSPSNPSIATKQGKRIKKGKLQRDLGKKLIVSPKTKGIVSVIAGVLALGSVTLFLLTLIWGIIGIPVVLYLLSALFITFSLVYGFSSMKKGGKLKKMGLAGIIMGGISGLVAAGFVVYVFVRVFGTLFP